VTPNRAIDPSSGLDATGGPTRAGAGAVRILSVIIGVPDQKPRSVAKAAASISARRSIPSRNIDSAPIAVAA
jgi:hypothetical protein